MRSTLTVEAFQTIILKGINISKLMNWSKWENLMKENNIKNAQKNVRCAQFYVHFLTEGDRFD